MAKLLALASTLKSSGLGFWWVGDFGRGLAGPYDSDDPLRPGGVGNLAFLPVFFDRYACYLRLFFSIFASRFGNVPHGRFECGEPAR